MTSILHDLIRIVAHHNGIAAGKAGFELWYKPGNEVRHENTCATMHCRAAGKLLARAERLGLVRHRQHGPAKLWYANATVSGAAEPRTLDGLVGDREYCLICRREMMTESGHVCSSCANEKKLKLHVDINRLMCDAIPRQ